MSAKQEQFEELYNNPEQESEFLLKASTPDVFTYTDWKMNRAKNGKDNKYFICNKCTRASHVFVSPGEIPNCSFCDIPLIPSTAPKIVDTMVTVPLAYDRMGRPLPGKTVRVPRKAANSWGNGRK